jgi:Transcriptional regulatory protein, C terminal
MQVLLYLVEHAGQVVTKDRLMASVWADTAVGDDALTRAVSEFGDSSVTRRSPRASSRRFPRAGTA